jgi:hypothetical protein
MTVDVTTRPKLKLDTTQKPDWRIEGHNFAS